MLFALVCVLYFAGCAVAAFVLLALVAVSVHLFRIVRTQKAHEIRKAC